MVNDHTTHVFRPSRRLLKTKNARKGDIRRKPYSSWWLSFQPFEKYVPARQIGWIISPSFGVKIKSGCNHQRDMIAVSPFQTRASYKRGPKTH